MKGREKPRPVGILVFEGMTMLDFVGPADAFAAAKRAARQENLGEAAYQIVTIGLTGRACASEAGISVVPAFTCATRPLWTP